MKKYLLVFLSGIIYLPHILMPARKKKSAGKGFLGDAWNAVKSGAKQVAKSALEVAKQRRIVSGALKSAGYNNLAKIAHNAGYGRKKKRGPRKGKGPLMSAIGGAIGGWLPGWGRPRRGRGAVTDENRKVLIM